MDDTQTMHAMGIDDAYHVEQVLARGCGVQARAATGWQRCAGDT